MRSSQQLSTQMGFDFQAENPFVSRRLDSSVQRASLEGMSRSVAPPRGERLSGQVHPMSEQPNSSLPNSRTTRNGILLKKLNLRRDEEDNLIQLDFRFAHYKSQISKKLLSLEQIDTWLSDASISVRSRMIIIEALLKREARPNTWHYKVPIFSVFYEIFFDKTVDVEAIKSILELFGIMSALLFSIVVAVTTTRNYEDLADAIERWDSYNCWIGGSGQIYWFIDVMAISMATSFAAFIFILFTYAVVVTSEFEEEENVASWWFYNRWAVFFSLIMLSISVLSLFAAFGNYVQWNVPNALLENEPCNSSMIASLDNVWGQFNCIINVTVGISVLSALSINSLAIAANHNNGVLWKTTSA